MRFIVTLILALASIVELSAATYRVDEVPNVQIENRHRFVTNPDGIISADAEARLDTICYSLRHRGIAQVSIVAIDDISPSSTFDFAHKLFSQWGVGDGERDNGLGILFVKDAREIRFVTGYGLEGVLPDALCKRVQMNYMLPSFRRGDYSEGLVLGLLAVDALLSGSELDAGINGDFIPEDESSTIILLVLIMVVGLPMLISIVSYYRTYRCRRCGHLPITIISEVKVSSGDNFDTIDYTYRCPKCGDTTKRRARKMREDRDLSGPAAGGFIIGGGLGSSRRGGGFGGGGFGGGGFGGGGFGGGGAGSSW